MRNNLVGKMLKIIYVLLFTLSINNYYCHGTFINKNVECAIDLKSHLVKVSHKIFPEHVSGVSKERYIYLVPQDECQHLAFITAQDSHKREVKRELKKTKNGCEFHLSVDMNVVSPAIYVETEFRNLLSPRPKEILQSEKQLVEYTGNAHFLSPYKTTTQKTTLQLSSQNILSYTPIKPVSVSNQIIKYGSYENIPEFSNTSMTVHYENQMPFLTVTDLERVIEVSHWGNIAVEEKIHLIHSGAKLKGQFSRYELQRNSRSGQSAIRSYKTILPATSTGVYYRDSNGNISTSNMRIMHDSVELELRPRFLLFGGWKTNYILGYNVPSYEYLYNNGNRFKLHMRVIDHIYDDMSIDHATVKIVLPEGAKDIKLITPYPVKRHGNEIYHTYLDTIGRPVVSFSKDNLVERHIQDFQLEYTYTPILMLQEPLLLVGFIFTLFVIVIIYVRLDFSIAKKDVHYHKD